MAITGGAEAEHRQLVLDEGYAADEGPPERPPLPGAPHESGAGTDEFMAEDDGQLVFFPVGAPRGGGAPSGARPRGRERRGSRPRAPGGAVAARKRAALQRARDLAERIAVLREAAAKEAGGGIEAAERIEELDGDRAAALAEAGMRSARRSDAPCGARCRGARGPDCSCSCGGINHGGERSGGW